MVAESKITTGFNFPWRTEGKANVTVGPGLIDRPCEKAVFYLLFSSISLFPHLHPLSILVWCIYFIIRKDDFVVVWVKECIKEWVRSKRKSWVEFCCNVMGFDYTLLNNTTTSNTQKNQPIWKEIKLTQSDGSPSLRDRWKKRKSLSSWRYYYYYYISRYCR